MPAPAGPPAPTPPDARLTAFVGPVSRVRDLRPPDLLAACRPAVGRAAAEASAVTWLMTVAVQRVGSARVELRSVRPSVPMVTEHLWRAGRLIGAAGAGAAAERVAAGQFTVLTPDCPAPTLAAAHAAALVAAAAIGDRVAFDQQWVEVERLTDPHAASQAAVLYDPDPDPFGIGESTAINDYRHDVARAAIRLIFRTCRPVAFNAVTRRWRPVLDAVLAAGGGRVPGFPHLTPAEQAALEGIVGAGPVPGDPDAADGPAAVTAPDPQAVFWCLDRGFQLIPERLSGGRLPHAGQFRAAAAEFRTAGALFIAAGWGQALIVAPDHPAHAGLVLLTGGAGLSEPDPPSEEMDAYHDDQVAPPLIEALRIVADYWPRRRNDLRAALLVYIRGLLGMADPVPEDPASEFGDIVLETYPAVPPAAPVTVLSAAVVRARLDAAHPLTPRAVGADPTDTGVSQPPPPDGPFGASRFRAGDKVTDLEGLMFRLTKELWDEAMAAPRPARDVTDVMAALYPGDDAADDKFKSRVMALNKRFADCGIPYFTEKRNGKIELVRDAGSAEVPKGPEKSPEIPDVPRQTSPGRSARSA